MIVAFALAFSSEVVLFLVKPELLLPRWAPTQGGFIGMVLVAVTRSAFPPRAKLKQNTLSMSPQEVCWRQDDLRKRIVQKMRIYLAASALFMSIAVYFILMGSPKARAASSLILIGTAYLVNQIRERGLTVGVSKNASVDQRLDSYRVDFAAAARSSISESPTGTTGRCFLASCCRFGDIPIIHTGFHS